MSTEVTTKQPSPAETFRGQLEKMEPEFKAALPDHIPVDRFKRVVLTAVNQNQALFGADRRSLFQSCTQAAQDGLLPDGREAAFVIFRSKDRESGGWIDKVQYMPMIAGILKKVRNSGQLSGISANVVYAGDHFDYELGDNERIYHKPNLANRGAPIAAYAVAHLKDGTIEREVMTVDEINQVREVSRAKDSGPWVQWWGEMARKTVIRRLSKRLPMSSDLETLIHRDDTFYKLDEPREAAPPPPRPARLNYVEPISRHPEAAETVPDDAAPQSAAGDHPAEDAQPDAEKKDVDTAPPQAGGQGKKTDTKPARATAKPPEYQFVNWDGTVTDYPHAGLFVDAVDKAIEAVPDASTLKGLWETNEKALDRLKTDGDQGPGWYDELVVAYDYRKAKVGRGAADPKQGSMV